MGSTWAHGPGGRAATQQAVFYFSVSGFVQGRAETDFCLPGSNDQGGRILCRVSFNFVICLGLKSASEVAFNHGFCLRRSIVGTAAWTIGLTEPGVRGGVRRTCQSAHEGACQREGSLREQAWTCRHQQISPPELVLPARQCGLSPSSCVCAGTLRLAHIRVREPTHADPLPPSRSCEPTRETAVAFSPFRVCRGSRGLALGGAGMGLRHCLGLALAFMDPSDAERKQVRNPHPPTRAFVFMAPA